MFKLFKAGPGREGPASTFKGEVRDELHLVRGVERDSVVCCGVVLETVLRSPDNKV